VLISDGHYTKSGNYSISNEEKGRRALATHVSHLRERRHDLTKRISLLPNSKKSQQNILDTVLIGPAGYGARCNTYPHICVAMGM
jgi:hypothetical protein